MPYFANALQLLIKVAFDAVLVLFLLRLFAEYWRADFHNPVSQFIYRYSNPVLVPVRRVIPNWRRLNLAALAIAWVAELVKWALLFATTGAMPHVAGWLLLGLGALLDFAMLVYVVLVFVWALSSLFGVRPGQGQHPVVGFISQLVEPAMRPLGRRLPTLGGIDFSPTVAILVLLLARILVARPLVDAGLRMALTGL